MSTLNTLILFTLLLQVQVDRDIEVAKQMVEQARPAATEKWTKEVVALEQLNAQHPCQPKTILFAGSSSIRLWKNIQEDMAPWPVAGRGYGGAKFTDLNLFIERLLANQNYRALVVFVGNDISGEANSTDRSPEEVLALFKLLVHQVQSKSPAKPIFMVAITPTPKRFHLWSQISRANKLIREFCQSQANVYFINTVPAYLDEDGRPRTELFTDDQLHQNQSGYATWSGMIKASLEDKLGQMTP